jgi:hypothetical protein
MKATISKAKYRMAFEINQSHCKNAKPKDPCRCVVAQAMYDKFGDHLATVHVLSTKTTLYFHSGSISRGCGICRPEPTSYCRPRTPKPRTRSGRIALLIPTGTTRTWAIRRNQHRSTHV